MEFGDKVVIFLALPVGGRHLQTLVINNDQTELPLPFARAIKKMSLTRGHTANERPNLFTTGQEAGERKQKQGKELHGIREDG
jgi:hypothetical protein